MLPSVAGAETVRLLAAGPDTDAQAKLAKEIARAIERGTNIDVKVQLTAGTPENLLSPRSSQSLRLAYLQADAAAAYLGAGQRGNPAGPEMLIPFSVIAPLHREHIFFIVRRDAAMTSYADMAGARINLGPMHGGTALSTTLMYRLMFGVPLPDAQASFLSHEDALVKLITEKSIDVVALVAAQPARLLADMKPEAKRFVKLLRFDQTSPQMSALLSVYRPITVPAATYPNVLDDDLSTLSVDIYLAAAGVGQQSDSQLARATSALCKALPKFQNDGHPEWRNISFEPAELASGWQRSRIAERAMRTCLEGGTPQPEQCGQESRALGLCS